MKITDLRIGDIVCNKRTKYPMKVVGIYEDGTVYLDFEGNEGDVFEENCKDLEFVDGQQKPEEVSYEKCFYNDCTKRTYDTLKEAKLANVNAHILRCWLFGEEIKYLSLVGACGTTVRTIKEADETISDAIEKGIVGVGFKDKRMC